LQKLAAIALVGKLTFNPLMT